MSDPFGFDSRMVLDSIQANQRIQNERAQTDIQRQQANMQQQATLANLANQQYEMQRQRSLADLVSQNSGMYSDPSAQAFARGGYLNQANEAQNMAAQRQMTAQKLLDMHTDLTRSRLSAAKTPDQIDSVLSTMSPDVKSFYGLPGASSEDGANDKIQGFIQAAITPEQRSEMDLKRDEMNKSRYRPDAFGRVVDTWTGDVKGNAIGSVGVNPVTGGYYNKRGGGVPVGGQPASGGDGSAPAPDASPFPGLKPKDIEGKWKELSDTVSTVKGRANLNAQLQNRLYASERVKNAALDEDGNVKNLDPTMIAEVAAGTAALLANGSTPAEHTVQQFMPKGRGMGQANILEWLTNDPQGANQQGFIKQMVNLSNREEALISKQMQAGQLQGVPRLVGLRKLDRGRFDSVLKGAGLDPASIDDNGLPAKKAASPAHTPEEIDSARAWLKDPKNGTPTQRAEVQAILEGK